MSKDARINLSGGIAGRFAGKADSRSRPPFATWLVLGIVALLLSVANPVQAQQKLPVQPGNVSTLGGNVENTSAANAGGTARANNAADLSAGPPAAAAPSLAPSVPGLGQVPDLSKKENVSAAMQMIVLLTVLSLAPAILLMMTSFTRIVIVLSLLRQALGAQSLPPNQVLIGLSMFMTFLIMAPTWSQVNENALKPYMDGKDAKGNLFTQEDALREAEKPIRDFMIKQIVKNGNDEDVDLFATYGNKPKPKIWEDVKMSALVPAFMLSELKTAFLMGFKIYLPFLIIDMVISTVLISMGMMMLPPAMISLPFKLLLFVLVSGWHLIVSNLLGSFAT